MSDITKLTAQLRAAIAEATPGEWHAPGLGADCPSHDRLDAAIDTARGRG